MRSGVRILLIIRTASVSATKIPANSRLLSLPHLHANSTGTTGPVRILRISPRLLPCQPSRHLSRSKCGDLSPHFPRSFSPFSYLHIYMILATQHALRVPVSQRISSHLHVLSNVSAVPISYTEQSLGSSFLIGISNWRYRLFILSFINVSRQDPKTHQGTCSGDGREPDNATQPQNPELGQLSPARIEQTNLRESG
jgi:hypothetical protein